MLAGLETCGTIHNAHSLAVPWTSGMHDRALISFALFPRATVARGAMVETQSQMPNRSCHYHACQPYCTQGHPTGDCEKGIVTDLEHARQCSGQRCAVFQGGNCQGANLLQVFLSCHEDHLLEAAALI